MSEQQDFDHRHAAQPSGQDPLASDPQSRWGIGIRALYDAVIQEPLPIDFQRLVEELAKKSSGNCVE